MLVLVGAAFVFSTGHSAVWAGDDTAKARAMYTEGISLEASGNFAGALDKFQAVSAIKRTPGVLFHVALCEEKLGRLNEAYGGYKVANYEATAAQSKNRKPDPKLDEIIQDTTNSITALEKRIPSLVIKKPADVTKVKLDGQDLGAEALRAPIKLDPGSHSIEATGAGHEPFRTTVDLPEGTTKTVEITLKDLASSVDTSSTPASSASSSSEPTTDGSASAAQPPEKHGSSVLPWAIMGSGAGVAIIGGIFLGLRQSNMSKLNDPANCHPDGVCLSSVQGAYNDAKTDSIVGDTLLGVGVVGIGVGLVMLLTSGGSGASSQEAAPQAAPPSDNSSSRSWFIPRFTGFEVAPLLHGGATAQLSGQF